MTAIAKITRKRKGDIFLLFIFLDFDDTLCIWRVGVFVEKVTEKETNDRERWTREHVRSRMRNEESQRGNKIERKRDRDGDRDGFREIERMWENVMRDSVGRYRRALYRIKTEQPQIRVKLHIIYVYLCINLVNSLSKTPWSSVVLSVPNKGFFLQEMVQIVFLICEIHVHGYMSNVLGFNGLCVQRQQVTW